MKASNDPPSQAKPERKLVRLVIHNVDQDLLARQLARLQELARSYEIPEVEGILEMLHPKNALYHAQALESRVCLHCDGSGRKII